MLKRTVILFILTFCSTCVYIFADSPACSHQTYDEDGDGWGWEHGRSCQVHYPLCEQEDDPDGDGWGWKRFWGVGPGIYNFSYYGSCLVYYPDCEFESSDPDGDGWGWENDKVCVISYPADFAKVPLTVDSGIVYFAHSAYRTFTNLYSLQRNYRRVDDSFLSEDFPYQFCQSKHETDFSWENQEFCFAMKQLIPCTSTAIPLAPKGWGWDNGRVCAEEVQDLVSCGDAVEDLDRDGWVTDTQSHERCIAAPQMANTRNISISNGYILDTTGEVFTPRGVKLTLGRDRQQNSKAIEAIASTGANLVDLQLKLDTAHANLRHAIDLAISHKMIVLLTIDHDESPTNKAIADAWISWKVILLKEEYQAYLLLGVSELKAFSSSTTPENTLRLRDEGFNMPFVVSVTPERNASTINSFKRMIEQDPQHNLILSLEAYYDNQIDSFMLGDIAFENVAYIARIWKDSDEPEKLLEHMRNLQRFQRAWIAESWEGSKTKVFSISIGAGGPRPVTRDIHESNISSRYDALKVTAFGQEILYGEFGIRNTSVKARSFSN